MARLPSIRRAGNTARPVRRYVAIPVEPSVVSGGRWQRVSLGVDALARRQLVTMPAPAGRPGDRLGHDRVRDLVKPLADPPQPQVAQGGAEAIHEGIVSQQAEGEGRGGADQEL